MLSMFGEGQQSTRRVAGGAGAMMAAAVAAALAAAAAVPAAAAEPLPRLKADPTQVSVSGLSSGGFMAVQMQTIFSSEIMGAGIFAGGPFGCARGAIDIGTLTQAISHCVNIEQVQFMPGSGGSFLGAPDVGDLVDGAKRLEAAGAIDPLSGLADDRIYLFSGTADKTVPQPVMTALRQWYAAVGVPEGAVEADFAVDAGHAMITTDWRNACSDTELPFINDCDLDGASATLTQIYGPLKPADGSESGRIVTFDQQAFVSDSAPAYNGLHAVGHVFIPAQCEADAPGASDCKLHVVFHGCEQNQDFIADQYWTRTGYNTVAAANDIVVLYPQTKASPVMPNPKGCWDWWGFTDADPLAATVGFLSKSGTQTSAVKAMIDTLTGRRN